MTDEYSPLRSHCRDASDTSEELTALSMQSARTRRLRFQEIARQLAEFNDVMCRIEDRQYDAAIRNQGNVTWAVGHARADLPENRKKAS